MMKRMAVVCCALVGWACSLQAEMVSLVQITDMRGQVGYEIMNREEFASLMKEIKEETTVYTQAAAESKKEWDANKDNKMAFQGARVKPRSAKKMGADFSDREKADKKKAQMEDRASEKQLEELDKAAKKAKQSKPSDEAVAKEEARVRAFEDAFAMISKKMGDKLGRPVPSFGFTMEEPKKAAEKKDEKAEKKDEKKEEKKGGH